MILLTSTVGCDSMTWNFGRQLVTLLSSLCQVTLGHDHVMLTELLTPLTCLIGQISFFGKLMICLHNRSNFLFGKHI
jgi:hypothetical protein